MKNRPIRILISVVSLFSIVLASSAIRAGSIKLSDVVQVVSSNPNKSNKTNFTELRLDPQDESRPSGAPQPQQTPPVAGAPRIQSEEVVEITEEPCDCADLPVPPPVVRGGGFPWWVLGFGAVPLLFLIRKNDRDTPTPTPPDTPTPTPTVTPTPTETPTMTPTPTVTPTPTMTPTETPTVTPTPTMTPTVTPTITPPPTMTPTPKPVPEPLTLLLFGTGLAGVGAVARRRWRKKQEEEADSE